VAAPNIDRQYAMFEGVFFHDFAHIGLTIAQSSLYFKVLEAQIERLRDRLVA
jgi:hypothetical protein